ncbi:hypothetical protein KVT40_007128 [Elsinoe batatas]|uniref:Uncharacterized protein n=1 Tax=Elsinoe batatas TaxID=2601811 RepID=A0A8K0KXK0_9PEZI|nr:hypothetical protein KVT40_007128 [Elsinoe batatas]
MEDTPMTSPPPSLPSSPPSSPHPNPPPSQPNTPSNKSYHPDPLAQIQALGLSHFIQRGSPRWQEGVLAIVEEYGMPDEGWMRDKKVGEGSSHHPRRGAGSGGRGLGAMDRRGMTGMRGTEAGRTIGEQAEGDTRGSVQEGALGGGLLVEQEETVMQGIGEVGANEVEEGARGMDGAEEGGEEVDIMDGVVCEGRLSDHGHEDDTIPPAIAAPPAAGTTTENEVETQRRADPVQDQVIRAEVVVVGEGVEGVVAVGVE